MADIQIVMKVLGQEGVEALAKSTISLENRVKALHKSLQAGRIVETQFNTAIKELRRELDRNGKSWQSNKAQLDGYVKQLQVSDAAAKASIAAQEQLNQQRKVSATVLALQTQKERELAQQQKVAAQETKAQAAEEERLKVKFVEGHAAMNLYSKELNDLATARKLNLISAEQQRQRLAQLNQELQTGTGRFSSYNLQAGVATKGNNRLGVVTQQAGYQVGDFLVQVQSGTNMMVAFGQQATQMVGTFAMLSKTTKGIAIFSALGVAIPLLTAVGAAIMRTNGDAKTLKQSFDDLKSVEEPLKSLGEVIGQNLLGNIDATRAAVGNLAADLYKLRADEALKSMKKAMTGAGGFQAKALTRLETKAPSEFGGMAGEGSEEVQKIIKDLLGGNYTTQNQLEDAFAKAYDELLKIKGVTPEIARDFLKIGDDAGIVLRQIQKVNDKADIALEKAKTEIEAMTAETNAFVDAWEEAIIAGKKADDVVKAKAEAAVKEQSYTEKAKEDQIEILKLEGKSVEARRLAVKLAGEKAAQEVYSKFTNEELNRLTGNQKVLLAQAAAEASRNAEEAARTAIGLDDAKDKAKGLADNLRSAAATLASVANISNSLGATITSLTTEVNLLNKGESTGVAGFIARESEKINEGVKKLSKEGYSDLLIESWKNNQNKKLDIAAELLRKKEAKIEADREAEKAANAAGKANVSSLVESLLTEQEKVDAWRKESLAKLEEFNNLELEILGGHAEAKARIEQEYRKKVSDLNAQKLGDMSDFFGAAASITAAGGQKIAKVTAAFQGIQATISAYSAYAQVMADPAFIGRPWARFAAAANVLAAGLGAAKAIKAAGSGGAGGGVSGASATMSSSASSATTPQRVIIEGIDRNSLYSGDQLSKIFEALYKENKDRGFVFEVKR